MSKELEALEKIGGALEETDYGTFYIWENYYDEYKLIQQALKEREQLLKENLVLSIKEQALEIIINKNVQISILKNSNDFESYNRNLSAMWNKSDIKRMSLTQEKFNLLKEVLP